MDADWAARSTHIVKANETAKTMSCGTCPAPCQSFGKHRNGLARFRCPQCKKAFTEPHRLTLAEMSEEKMLLAAKLLVEGNSIRSTQRITGIDQNTIMKWMSRARMAPSVFLGWINKPICSDYETFSSRCADGKATMLCPNSATTCARPAPKLQSAKSASRPLIESQLISNYLPFT
jgi:transposase-like protein